MRSWFWLVLSLVLAVGLSAAPEDQLPIRITDPSGFPARSAATADRLGNIEALSLKAGGVDVLSGLDVATPADDAWVPLSASGSDWSTESACGLAADSNDDGLTVLLCDDTTLEGWGGRFSTPAALVSVRFRIQARPDVAPGGAVGARVIVTCREAAPGSTTSAWGTARAVGAFAFGATEAWEELVATLAIADLGISAGSVVQCQFAREPGHGTDTLTGDLAVLDTKVGFR